MWWFSLYSSKVWSPRGVPEATTQNMQKRKLARSRQQRAQRQRHRQEQTNRQISPTPTIAQPTQAAIPHATTSPLHAPRSQQQAPPRDTPRAARQGCPPGGGGATQEPASQPGAGGSDCCRRPWHFRFDTIAAAASGRPLALLLRLDEHQLVAIVTDVALDDRHVGDGAAAGRKGGEERTSATRGGARWGVGR